MDDQVRSNDLATYLPPVLIHSLFPQCVRDTQSWYRVEHPKYSRHGPRDRDTDYYSYSEEGSDRRSDAQPLHYTNSDSASHVESLSPVPTVHRQEGPGLGSRMYEQFPGGRPPGPPASVTRLDLHEEEDRRFDGGGGFDRRQHAAYPTASQYPQRQSFAPDPRRPHRSHRRPSQQPAYQVHIVYFIADPFPFISTSD